MGFFVILLPVKDLSTLSLMRLRETYRVQDLVRNRSRDHCLLALVQDHPVE